MFRQTFLFLNNAIIPNMDIAASNRQNSGKSMHNVALKPEMNQMYAMLTGCSRRCFVDWERVTEVQRGMQVSQLISGYLE